jgi:hypothetical protein
MESIQLLALATTQTKSKKWSLKHFRKSQQSRGSGSESDGGSSDNEKHASLRTNWRDTQECYRCRKKGQIARYCPSTVAVESGASTETAAAAAAATAATTIMTTSVESYWMTVTNRKSPSKESWYLVSATTTHNCGDRQ